MFGHVEVEDAPPMVGEHDQDEEDAQPSSRNGEEIDGDQVADMVDEERAPGLRGRCAPLRDQPGDGALGDGDAELQELALDSWGSSARERGMEFIAVLLQPAEPDRLPLGGPR